MSSDIKKMRAEFEASLADGELIERDDSGDYLSSHVDAMWSAWLAAVQHRGGKRPEPCPDIHGYVSGGWLERMVDKGRALLGAAPEAPSSARIADAKDGLR